MKKTLFSFLISFLFFSLVSYGQDTKTKKQTVKHSDSTALSNKTFLLKFGVNLLDSTGEHGPFNAFSTPEEMAFSTPLKFGIEYRFGEFYALGLDASINKWKAPDAVIDGAFLLEDQDYFAIDANFKVYYDEVFNWLTNTDWLDLYLNGGVGFFKVNDGSFTGNFGGGANIWLSPKLGLNIEALAKWTLDNKPAIYESNHFQYSIGLTYRFNDSDFDNDGIKDYNDKCPKVSGNKENNGCPNGENNSKKNNPDNKSPQDNNNELHNIRVDSDNDGVFDKSDDCPKIPGVASNRGCPLPDRDGDGVLDIDDKCPNIIGDKANNGCPTNSTNNLLSGNTQNDKIVRNSSVNNETNYSSNDGLSSSHIYNSETDITETDLKVLFSKIKFNEGNYNFTQDTYPVLIKIVIVMKQNITDKYRIEGHTDSSGSYTANRYLSKTRANAVKNYLVDSGIPATNIQCVGLGESKPIASNLTPEGRSKNRRVDIIIIK